MLNIFELIENRRSVFPAQYNQKPIKKSTLLKVLASANWAPNHRKTEPWRFKVLQGEAKMKLGDFLVEEMQSANPDLSNFKKRKTLHKFEASSAILAICMQRDPKEQLPEWEEIAATAMAVQNIWLACTAEQIGAYWSSPKAIENFHQYFNFEDGEKCLGLFYMGYYDGDLPEGKRNSDIAEKIEWLD
jgi:nitroreductase